MTASLLILFLALTPHQARQKAIGSTVTVEGHVTVASGVFRSFMNDNGFVVSDAIGGIYVVTDYRAYHSLGSDVRVIGTLADNGHGLLVLRAVSITSGKGHALVRPWKVERPQLDEFYEGKLVRAEGEIVRLVSDLPYGHKLILRRGGSELQVFLPATVMPDPGLLTAGRKVEVTGFCAQYDQTYEIVVRSARDLVGAPKSPSPQRDPPRSGGRCTGW